MRPLAEADPSTFRSVRFVLTDMDETLTHHERLSARTYDSLERLQQAGVKVIPVTAAPAGWCDQMARMWPLDGVIGENGGFFFRRGDQGLERMYWHSTKDQPFVAQYLVGEIAQRVQAAVPAAVLAQDQPYRLTSVAFNRPQDEETRSALTAALQEAGAGVAANDLWVVGWIGGYDKLTMTRRILAEVYGVNIDADRDTVLYVGDSSNDASMFAFFHHTVGVSTVTRYLSEIPIPPYWITSGPGGEGFVEAADAVIRSRTSAI
jgi:hypothetical protein